MINFSWYISFHGGTGSSDWNNIHAFSSTGTVEDPAKVLDKSTLPDDVTLRELRGMTWGSDGNLYVVNAYKEYSQILQFDGSLNQNQQHSFLSVFVSEPGGHPFQAVFGPMGDMYVANQDTLNVTRYYGPGSTKGAPGKPVGDGVFVSGLSSVRGIGFGPNGNFYVVDETVAGENGGTGKIYICDPDNGNVLGCLNDPDGHLDKPVHLLFKGNLLYIGNSGKDNLLYYDFLEAIPEIKVYVHKGDAQLDGPSGLLFGPDALLYVASRKGKQINRYTPAEDGHSAEFLDVFIGPDLLEDSPEFLQMMCH